MQDKYSIDTNSIIDRLKKEKNIESDADFAELIGITPSTLSAARSRNSMNLRRLFDYFEGYSADWILYGVGTKFLEDKLLYNSVAEPAIEYSESSMIGRLRNLEVDNDEKLKILDLYLELLHNSKKSNE